ncbi:MAG: type II toxin-antitoxin system YafQ family toxin [bacterium]
MRILLQTSRFKKDIRRQLKRGKDREKMVAVTRLLAAQGSLPPDYKPHPLQGEWKGTDECHIEPDWLLVYAVTESSIILHRTGTHADLFE